MPDLAKGVGVTTEFATPRLYQGNIVMWASGKSEDNQPTPYPSMAFADAYRVVSLVGEAVHSQVFKSQISEELAKTMIQTIGLDESQYSTWESPFYALAQPHCEHRINNPIVDGRPLRAVVQIPRVIRSKAQSWKALSGHAREQVVTGSLESWEPAV